MESYFRLYVETLNTSRTNRIQEYKLMKDKITTHANDLVKMLHDEEQALQKKIDARIQYETEYALTVTFLAFRFVSF